MKLFRLLVTSCLTLLALAQAGCGFHLRGDAGLPEAYQSMRVQASAAMRDALQVYLQGAEDGGGPLLKVSNEKYDRRVLSVDPNSGRVREVAFSYSAVYQVQDDSGGMVLEPNTVRLTRDYIFDETSVFGSSREENVLKQEMRRDAADRIVRHLRASLK